jgi:hypothetical protein
MAFREYGFASPSANVACQIVRLPLEIAFHLSTVSYVTLGAQLFENDCALTLRVLPVTAPYPRTNHFPKRHRAAILRLRQTTRVLHPPACQRIDGPGKHWRDSGQSACGPAADRTARKWKYRHALPLAAARTAPATDPNTRYRSSYQGQCERTRQQDRPRKERATRMDEGLGAKHARSRRTP